MPSKTPVFVCPQHGAYRPPHPPKDRIEITDPGPQCDGCWSAYGHWRVYNDQRAKVKSVGRARGGGQSSKKKGRKAVQIFQQALLAAAPWLEPEDIFVKATSMMGVDIHFSPRAAAWFSYAPEVKCVERFDIWGALRQADANASPTRPPLVAFKRASTEMYVALRLTDFLRLLPNGQIDRARVEPRP